MNFRAKTILGIAFIEIVLLVILVVSAMSFLSDSNEKQLLQRAQATATMFSHATKDAVLATDLATLNDLVAEIMTLEDVVYVRIVSYGRVLASDGKAHFLDEDSHIDEDLHSIKDGVFDTKVDIINDGAIYGNIDIGFATSAISIMLNQAKKSIIAIASLEVVMVALFSFVLGTYLTKNLVKLKHAAQIVRKKGPGFQIELNQKDELGEVAEAFNNMSKSLQESYHELHLAREEAEHANEIKSRFLASMSHEIRTPLTGVLGLLTSLQNSGLNKEQTKLVNTASESGKLLHSLINNILDFSKMEANNITIQREAFNLHSTIHSILDSFLPQAKSKGVTLEIQSEHLPEFLIGDAIRYKQILFNLVGNAVKFTEKGSISVHFSQHETDKQTFITCKITDSGIGIKSESIPLLFEEFTMADQSLSRPQEGSGLGLAICKRLIDLLDGDIEVESVEGLGSCFSFTIPFEPADKKSIQNNVNIPATLNEKCKDLSILVAEDNKANQLVIQSLFKHIGLVIDIANNGVEAIEKVNITNYDIIFMDISMPEMDGLEASKIIRSMNDHQKSSVPIIAFTAHALTGDKEKFLKAGMTDYLAKPVNLSHLISILNSHIAFETSDPKQPEIIQPDTTNSELDDHSESINFQHEPELNSNKSDNEFNDKENIESTKNMDSTKSIDGTKNMDNDLVDDNMNTDDELIDEELIEQELIEDDLVDEEILLQLVLDTSADVMPMLIDSYIEEANEHKLKIQETCVTKDIQTLKFEVHTLSSCSKALGNSALSSMAKHIESYCVNNDHETAFHLTTQLIALTEQSLHLLNERKKQGFD